MTVNSHDGNNVIKVAFGKKKPIEEPVPEEIEPEPEHAVEIDCSVDDPVIRNGYDSEHWPGFKYLNRVCLAIPLGDIKI